MTVRDLIAQLQSLPPDLPVVKVDYWTLQTRPMATEDLMVVDAYQDSERKEMLPSLVFKAWKEDDRGAV